MDPQPRGPDWMQITPKPGSLFHAKSQLAVARVENRPARLDLSAYPYLPAANVAARGLLFLRHAGRIFLRR